MLIVVDESIGWVENQTSQELSFSAQHEIVDSFGCILSMSADFDRDGNRRGLLLKNEGKVVLFEIMEPVVLILMSCMLPR